MRPELRAHAVRQGGIVTRRQAQAAGYSRSELRRLTRRHGPWISVRPGAYAERTLWDAADEVGRGLMGDVSAHLMMVTDHVMSHDSAARALRIPMLRPERALTHITRSGVGGSRTESGVKHHLTRRPLDVRRAGTLPITAPARTALDLAREHGLEMGLVAVDHVRARGVGLAELTAESETMWSWPHVLRVRDAISLSDPRAETPAESLARLLLHDLGFVDVDVGWPIAVGGHVYWVDLRVGCHLVEVDGLQKYLGADLGGIADRPTREVLRDERRRQTEICAEGLGMSRLIWDDLWGRARDRAGERLLREEAVTRARFGDRLPAHLADQAARIRRTRPRRTA